MAKTRILTNPNKLVEAKANFFADYFNWYSDQLGKVYEAEFENPLSLVDKIIFQVSSNNEKQRVRYINNHLGHNYFKHDKYLRRFTFYQPVRNYVQQYMQVSSSDVKFRHQWINSNTGFLAALQAFSAELKKKMINECLKGIISYLQCAHLLSKHKNGIRFYTKILVTQFYFSGRTGAEIANIFNRILQKKITDFPFPTEVVNIEDKKTWLADMSLQKQFMAMQHFFDEQPVNQFMITKVKGVRFEKKDRFSYDGIEFISLGHAKCKLLRKQLKEWKSSFFVRDWSKGDFLLAITPVKVFGDTPFMPELTSTLKKSIGYLSYKCGRLLAADKDTYFLTQDFTAFFFKFDVRDGVKVIGKTELEDFRNNGFTVLEKLNSPAGEWMLSNEHTLIEAAASESIEGFWRYLEYLLYPKKNHEIFLDVAHLLLLEEKETRKHHFVQFLFGTVGTLSFNYSDYGLSPQDFIEVRKLLLKFKTKEFYKKLNEPFFNEIRSMQNARHSAKRYDEVAQYYNHLLIELYESRNALTHSNLVENASLLKLQKSIPGLIRQMRYALFDLIKESPLSTFSEIIKAGVAKAKLLY